MYTSQRLCGWPFLTRLLREVSDDVQKALVARVWTSEYYIKVEPHPCEFWEVFKLKFPDWIVCVKQYKVSTFPYCTLLFYTVEDLVGWLLDTIGRPEVRGLLLLECMKYLPELR